MNTKIIYAVIAAGLLAIGTSCSGTDRTITVRGFATVYAAPDTVEILFTLSSNDKDIATAKKKNEDTVKQVNGIFTAHKVEQKYITIKRIAIEPRYSYTDRGRREFLYYEIRQTISVKLTDLDRYESFLTALLNAGIDTISDVNFSSKDLRTLTDEAHRKAVTAAEEKAQTLCTAAVNNGRKLFPTRVLRITEIPVADDPYRLGANFKQNAVGYADKNADSPAFSPSGQVQVRAQVEMVFELSE